MAFVTLHGFDVEHASSLLVIDNLFPEIQHIDGKGVTDKYTPTDDVTSINSIDVMRVLPYAPRFRQLGSANNGNWHNERNQGGVNNAPQSNSYTIPVDMFYDEGIPILDTQSYSNPIKLKSILMAQLVKTAGLAINIITFAKQIEGFFRDSFSEIPTQEEIEKAVFAYDSTVATSEDGSAVDAFIAANSELTDGVPEIGAMHIPLEERQAFISTQFDRIMKRQYQTNASDTSAKILATGFINPFSEEEGIRINSATGIAGMYDGVDMFIMNGITRKFTNVALRADKGAAFAKIEQGANLTGVTVNGETFGTKVVKGGFYEFKYTGGSVDSWRLDGENVLLADYGIAVNGAPKANDVITVDFAPGGVEQLLKNMDAMIVYGMGTVRGIVGPSVVANPHPFQGGVFILPKMKIGVEVLSGKTIKMVVKGGWTPEEIALIKNSIRFTPIDGQAVTGNDAFQTGIFNDGTSN